MTNDARRSRRPRRAFPSLKAYFQQTGIRQSDIAADAGITESHLSNIVSGRRDPSYPLALKLSELTNVPVQSLAPRTEDAA